MRGRIPGLSSPHPLAGHLPALFQEDDFAQRFTGSLDEVLAPVFWVLDNLDAYVDPALAPVDFVTWLASWVGLELDENWPLERRRALVQQAMDLYRWRGTVRGIAAYVELYTGVEPDIEDSGGVAWSAAPGGGLPGRPIPSLTVRVEGADPDEVDTRRLDRLVRAAKPAHVAHEVEVMSG